MKKDEQENRLHYTVLVLLHVDAISIYIVNLVNEVGVNVITFIHIHKEINL